MSREFENIETILTLWDFILGGVYTSFIQINQPLILPSLYDTRSSFKNVAPSSLKDTFQVSSKLPVIDQDPFINLDMLCTSMIVYLKESLLESDFSMCFATLLNFEEPETPNPLIA